MFFVPGKQQAGRQDRLNSKLNPKMSTMASAVAFAVLAATVPAFAQNAPAPSGDAPKERLEEVVVTANKRVEKLENVPLAITVLGDQMLERNNVRDLTDMINLSPALTITYGTTPANNGINMRGIGTTSIGIGVEADVAVIFDDIPVGMQVRAFQDLTDISRIEILKGPQNTLFGKSAIAGAVYIVSKPISGPIQARFSTLQTSDQEHRVSAAVSGAVSDQFGFRIAASENSFAGNVNNLTTGGKVNGSTGKTFMGKFSWHPTTSLDVDFMPRYNKTRISCCVLVLTSFTPLQGALLSNNAALPATSLLAGITPGPNNRDIRNDDFTGQDSTDVGGGVKVGYSFANGATLTSITSTDRYKANDNRDQDFVDVHTLLYYPLANGTRAGVNDSYRQYGTFDVKARTQELRLASPEGDTFRYVAGLWYGKNTIDRQFIRGYNGIALSTPVEYFANTYNINKAIFGQASWDFLPDYSVLAGLRYNRETSGYTFTIGPPPPAAFVPTGNFSSIDNTESSTTGKLSLQHQFSKNMMAYVMTSTGYKGLAYDLTSSLNAATAAQQPVKSETAKTYEIGFKGNLFDSRMTLNVAAFNSKFKDYQQNSGGYLPNTTTYVTRLNSVGGVQTKGVEMDMTALVTSNLLVNLSYAYTKATITEFPNAPCYNVQGSPNGGFNLECQLKNPLYGNQNVQNLAGGLMPNAPKNKLYVDGQYDVRLSEQSFDGFITAAYRYQSRVLTNLNQDPSLAVEGYGILNMGVGVRDKKDKYKVSFFVNNVLDKHYANTGFTGAGSWSSSSPNPVVPVTNTTWTPARDAFRYFGVRLDLRF